MVEELAQTSWREMRISHPSEWELAVASGAEEPGRCTFVDRTDQRLDLRWRSVKYVPDLDKMLQKHRGRQGDKERISEMADVPVNWRGLVRRTEGGTIVHAGTFFRNRRWLVEMAVYWPSRRNTALEREILSSVHAEDADADPRLWRAMGMSLRLDRQYDLKKSSASVGRVKWTFETGRKRGPRLVIERIAMADYWLKAPLRDWLESELPARGKVLRRDPLVYNTHRGEQLMSQSRISTLSGLRGLRNLHLDLAWTCPIEQRVYRVSFTEASRDEEASLPKRLEIDCCRPVALRSAFGSEAQARREASGSKTAAGPGRSRT